MSVRLLHLADLHLGAEFPSMGERGAERSRDLTSAFSRAVDYAMGAERPVDLVAIAGDLFDRHDPDESLVVLVEAALDRLAAAGIPILIVPGTHDAFTYRRSVYRRLRLPERAHLFRGPVLEAGPRLEFRGESVQTYGISYDPTASVRPLSGFRPLGEATYHVAVLHAALQDSPTWKIRPSDLPINREEIGGSGLHYLALGHYHNFAEIREGKSVALYPGTLEARKFGEDGPRYLVTATLGPGGVSINRAPWNARTVSDAAVDLVAGDIRDEARLIERVKAFAGEKEIVRVRIEGAAEFAFEPERLLARLKSDFFHLELDDRSYLMDAKLLDQFRDEATIRGAFVRTMLGRLTAASSEAERDRAALALRIGLAEFQNPRHAN
jgi:DNA repair exonuclease SbcCD nuclease subunit